MEILVRKLKCFELEGQHLYHSIPQNGKILNGIAITNDCCHVINNPMRIHVSSEQVFYGKTNFIHCAFSIKARDNSLVPGYVWTLAPQLYILNSFMLKNTWILNWFDFRIRYPLLQLDTVFRQRNEQLIYYWHFTWEEGD